MIFNLKLFLTISKKNPPNHQNQTLSRVFCIQGTVSDTTQWQRFWGFFKRVKNKNIICVNNFSKK